MVVDTSVFIEFLRKKDKSTAALSQISDLSLVCISDITMYELFCGATDYAKMAQCHQIEKNFRILAFDTAIAKQAGQIYQNLKTSGKLIGTADTLIAATALHHNLPLFTLNKKHFQRIPRLVVI